VVSPYDFITEGDFLVMKRKLPKFRLSPIQFLPSHIVGEELTPREVQIMEWVTQGLTIGEIGRRLGIHRSGIGRSLRKVYQKLGANNRITAIVQFTLRRHQNFPVGSIAS